MEIEQSFQVPFSPESVWRCFHDIEGIVGCLPGASLTAPPDSGKLKLAMTVKLGPIVAVFAGDGEIKLDDSTCSGNVTGGGSDRKSGSRVKGEAAFSLHDEKADGQNPSTRVDVRVVFSIAGSLAQFSRGGIVRELAARMTDAFADNIKSKLELETEVLSGALMTDSAAPPGAQTSTRRIEPATSAPLNLGKLFWSMLLSSMRKIFRLKRKIKA